MILSGEEGMKPFARPCPMAAVLAGLMPPEDESRPVSRLGRLCRRASRGRRTRSGRRDGRRRPSRSGRRRGGSGVSPAVFAELHLERVIARALRDLCPTTPPAKGEVLAFRSPATAPRASCMGSPRWAGPRPRRSRLASWLGFAMGSDTSLALSQSGTASDASFLPELLDPGTGFLLRDLSEGLRG